MIKFLLLLLLCFSCKSQNENFESIYYQLTKEWMHSFVLENIKIEKQEITRPPGVEQLIFSLLIPEDGGAIIRRHCVYYRIPYKQTQGKLTVEKREGKNPCPESSEGNSYATISEVSKLSIDSSDFQLRISFLQKSLNREMVIPLPNLSSGFIHQKFQPLRERKKYEGMSLLRLNDDSFDYSINRYLGKNSDKFSNGTAIRCHQVTKNCETVGENRCNECRYGWYEVVDFQCPQGGSKFCGQNLCGEKNEPACPRGTKVVDIEEAGICQNDLEPVPNADKILVCQ